MADKAGRYGVVVYRTTSAAYASEKVLQGRGLHVKVIPVPRSLSTDCCLGLRVSWEARDQVREVLRQEEIPFETIYSWP
ncbi:MAG: DUF3343 domain-containing protein [Chloroflexota bacterium]|nr:DUF3343 domain-containing protein [Chloroflexota bacterium]